MKIRMYEPERPLWWLIFGLIVFIAFFVVDTILTDQRLQLWIGDYHIHHSFAGLILTVTSSVVLAYKWKKREKLPQIAIYTLLFGIILMVEWGLLHYTECGGRYLLITKNE